VHTGIAGARNLGIRAAEGEIVAFVDADCTPAATWIERGRAQFGAREVDIVAGHIQVTVDRPSPVALVDLVQYFDQERYASDGFGATGNLWVRRDVFERVGLFDERLTRGEDEEFGRRAVAAGARLRYASDVVVSHPARGGWEQMRRCYKIGRERGVAGLRSRATTRPYVSTDRMRVRLAAAGYEPTARRIAAIRLAKNVCVRLPMAVGALSHGLREGRRATPDAAGSRASTGA
jgi:hypothetical protein